MVNLLTRKISREWSKLRALDYTDYVHLDNERLILTKFNQVKPMILQVVDDPSIESIKSWIRSFAISYGEKNDIRNRNIWVDLYECFNLLLDSRLLHVHNDQLK
jgi:hypothetical protein